MTTATLPLPDRTRSTGIVRPGAASPAPVGAIGDGMRGRCGDRRRGAGTTGERAVRFGQRRYAQELNDHVGAGIRSGGRTP